MSLKRCRKGSWRLSKRTLNCDFENFETFRILKLNQKSFNLNTRIKHTIVSPTSDPHSKLLNFNSTRDCVGAIVCASIRSDSYVVNYTQSLHSVQTVASKRFTQKNFLGRKNVKIWEHFNLFRFQVLSASWVWGLWKLQVAWSSVKLRMIVQVNSECCCPQALHLYDHVFINYNLCKRLWKLFFPPYPVLERTFRVTGRRRTQ